MHKPFFRNKLTLVFHQKNQGGKVLKKHTLQPKSETELSNNQLEMIDLRLCFVFTVRPDLLLLLAVTKKPASRQSTFLKH